MFWHAAGIGDYVQLTYGRTAGHTCRTRRVAKGTDLFNSGVNWSIIVQNLVGALREAAFGGVEVVPNDHRTNHSTHSRHGNRSTGGGAAYGAAQGAGSVVAAGADSQLGGVAACVGIDGVRVGCSPAVGRDGRVLATAASAWP